MIRAYLYDKNGEDRPVEPDEVDPSSIAETQTLWIDVTGDDPKALEELARRLDIRDETFKRLADSERDQHLDNFGEYFAFGVCAFTGDPDDDGSKLAQSTVLGFIVSDRWLVTTHARPVKFLDAFQAQDKGETKIGGLSPTLLAVSLLDWHLAEFFREVGRIEEAADALDEDILQGSARNEMLAKIVAGRARVSRLRARIAGQRPIFHGLSRPDFTADSDPEAFDQLAALGQRFDRAVDEIERTRDVVVGSFDLFTSMTAQRTNELVKVLTFLTAVIGICAAVAGVMGMNFKAGIFETGTFGFLVTLGSLVGIVVVSMVVARWRDWI